MTPSTVNDSLSRRNRTTANYVKVRQTKRKRGRVNAPSDKPSVVPVSPFLLDSSCGLRKVKSSFPFSHYLLKTSEWGDGPVWLHLTPRFDFGCVKQGTCRAPVQLAVLLDVGAWPTQVAAACLQCIFLPPMIAPVSSCIPGILPWIHLVSLVFCSSLRVLSMFWPADRKKKNKKKSWFAYIKQSNI